MAYTGRGHERSEPEPQRKAWEDTRRQLATLVWTLKAKRRQGLLTDEQADRLAIYERWLDDFTVGPEGCNSDSW